MWGAKKREGDTWSWDHCKTTNSQRYNILHGKMFEREISMKQRESSIILSTQSTMYNKDLFHFYR